MSDRNAPPTSGPAVIECVDLAVPGDDKRRIVLHATEREVEFINCLWPRKGLGLEPYHRCGFEEVLSATDFGWGKYRRLYIGTRQGRCAVGPDWEGFEELREALQRISSVASRGPLLDHPLVLGPLLFAAVFGIVAVVIYFLL